MLLEQLAPGTRFRVGRDGDGKEGVLMYCGPGSARVKWGTGGTKTITFTPKGVGAVPITKTINTPAEEENIAPRTEVMVVNSTGESA